MPHPFKAYEIDVLKCLLRDEFSETVFSAILVGALTPKVEFTNYGFYVSIKHSAIGKPRRVHSGPANLSGRFGDQCAGFIAFVEDDTLTLEIFPLNGEALPATFRDSDVRIVNNKNLSKIYSAI